MRARSTLIGLAIMSVFLFAGCEQSENTRGLGTKAPATPVTAATQAPEITEPTTKANPASSTNTPEPTPAGLFAFESISPTGSKSLTTLLESRVAPSGHKIATLQIDRADSTTLMDVAFDCPAQTYIYLFMDHNARPIDDAKIARVQSFSDKQLTAYSRGEALQKLTFSKLDTFPPENISDYTQLMNVACAK